MTAWAVERLLEDRKTGEQFWQRRLRTDDVIARDRFLRSLRYEGEVARWRLATDTKETTKGTRNDENDAKPV